MKTKILFLLATGMIILQSCNDEEKPLTNATATTLEVMYPTAKNVEWEIEGTYSVAEFYNEGASTKTWFDQNAQWKMTEIDITYDTLPTAVKTGFNESEYASWRIEDVDKLERPEMETVYVIEVENGNAEADLYFSPTGIPLKTITEGTNDSYVNYIPQQTGSKITSIISQKYPNAKIVEIDNENGMIAVEIVDETVAREVYLDQSGNWLYTQTDIHVANLPQIIKQAVEITYAGYNIDDVNYIETPTNAYYELELEMGNSEQKIKIDENGVILN